MTARRWFCLSSIVFALALNFSLAGCGGQSPPPPDEGPARFKSPDKLQAKLEEVAQLGVGGSSLGGLAESIEVVLKDDPDKKAKLLTAFKRLDSVASGDERKKIAKEMLDLLK